jgi:AraC-like DNA-binding protein
MGFMITDVTKNGTDRPEMRQDRLTALMAALQPQARPCATDDPAATLLLHPDRLVLRLQGERAPPDAALFAVRFEVAIPLHEALHGSPDTVVLRTHDAPALRQLVAVLLDEVGAGRCGSAETIARLAEALLVLALRRALDGSPPAHGVLAGLSHPRLHRAIVAIHADPGAAWTVEALADRAGMSRSRFMAVFRDLIGLSPLAYVTRWRMEIARAALERGAHPRDVARRVGYGSVPALRRVLRRHADERAQVTVNGSGAPRQTSASAPR